MLKFKIGDKVKILSGKDKGRQGNIEKIYPKEKTLIVPGVGMYKKHVKGGAGGEKAGIYELARAISFSRVGIICPKCSKVTRVGFKIIGDEKKRICAKCDREITVSEVKSKK